MENVDVSKIFELFKERISEVSHHHTSFCCDMGECYSDISRLKTDNTSYKIKADQGGVNIHSYISIKKKIGFLQSEKAKFYLMEIKDNRQIKRFVDYYKNRRHDLDLKSRANKLNKIEGNKI